MLFHKYSGQTDVVLGTVIVAATAVVIFNLCADIANALLDPRIKYG